jgi:hypothetical protein
MRQNKVHRSHADHEADRNCAFSGFFRKTTLNSFRQRSPIPISTHSISGEMYRNSVSVAG